MSTIVTRAGKGSPLTHSEMDANVTNLNNDKLQTPHTGSIEINNTTTSDSVTITTTEDSSTAAPVFTMKRNSASPADGDYLGQLKFKGENDADQEVVYAKITAKISDATDGTEDGLLEFANRKAGSNNIGMRLTSTELKLLNDTGLDLSTSKITDVGNPTSAQDAATKTYVDTADATKLPLAGGTMSGAIAMGANAITGVSDPSGAQDAATKAYADTKLANIVEDLSPQLGASLDVNGQSIVSISNGNIAITPDGTGKVILDGISYPTADGTANQVLKTDGSGVLSFTDASGFDGNLAGNTLTDSTGTLTIDSSASNRIKFQNSDGASTDGSILFNTFAFGTAIMSAMEYRTPGAFRLNKLEARGSSDDGTHDAYFYLYGEDPRIISQNPTTQAYVPIELRASAVEVFNGNTYLYKLPTADGSANQVLKTDGSGNLSFVNQTGGMSELVDDTTPQLGGDLDTNGHGITNSGSTGRVAVIGTGGFGVFPDGTGVTSPQLLVEDNGSNSIKITMKASNSDVVGNQIESQNASGNRGPFSFNAAATNFNSTSTIVFDATTSQSIKIGNANLIVIDANRIKLEKPTAPPTHLTTNLPTANMQGGELANVSNNQNKLVYYDNSASAWRYVGTDGLV